MLAPAFTCDREFAIFRIDFLQAVCAWRGESRVEGAADCCLGRGRYGLVEEAEFAAALNVNVADANANCNLPPSIRCCRRRRRLPIGTQPSIMQVKMYVTSLPVK